MVDLGIYSHWKGKIYEVIGFGLHSESSEELVLYRRANVAQSEIWARPMASFTSKLKDGRERFRLVSLVGPCIKSCGRTGLLLNGLCGVCQILEAQKRGERPLEKGN